MSRFPVIGFCFAAAATIATPALSDSCLPQQHVHQYIRAHYAHSATRATRIAYHRTHARHYVMMEEPYYDDTYDQYYDVSGPYWHSQPGWWEWHPADDEYL